MASVFKRSVAPNVSTETVVLSVDVGKVVTLIDFTIANVTTQDTYATALINAGGAVAHLVKDAPVPLGSACVVSGAPRKVVLEAGDTISVSSQGVVDVMVSRLEQDL